MSNTFDKPKIIKIDITWIWHSEIGSIESYKGGLSIVEWIVSAHPQGCPPLTILTMIEFSSQLSTKFYSEVQGVTPSFTFGRNSNLPGN
ncbi:unnamed protein product [Blepharisma stoltei]|uniref:Uncharacterized protein n=1 Tax=Blepharisma stoltei TaxID=1481888 RepID=A0AAU9ILB3_9CILI|nr:unnamed protein product [Blepharisma stoltei]